MICTCTLYLTHNNGGSRTLRNRELGVKSWEPSLKMFLNFNNISALQAFFSLLRGKIQAFWASTYMYMCKYTKNKKNKKTKKQTNKKTKTNKDHCSGFTGIKGSTKSKKKKKSNRQWTVKTTDKLMYTYMYYKLYYQLNLSKNGGGVMLFYTALL